MEEKGRERKREVKNKKERKVVEVNRGSKYDKNPLKKGKKGNLFLLGLTER